MLRKICLVIAMVSLTGCLSPVKSGNDAEYVLNPDTQAVAKRARTSNTLLVLKPTTNMIYNTPQMAYSTMPHQVSYFSKSRWATTPADMLQGIMVQALQNTHHYRAVVNVPALGHPEYILYTDLVELKQDFTTRPNRIQLKMRAQIVKTASNSVIASKEFNIDEPVYQATPYAGVMAANRAASELLSELTRFCVNAS